MRFNQNHILALIIIAVTVKLFIDHRKSGYSGAYQITGSYKNISAVKHDMTKGLWVEMFMVLVFGLAMGEQFYNPRDMLNSIIGKWVVVVLAYFTYHELIQPYVINMLPFN